MIYLSGLLLLNFIVWIVQYKLSRGWPHAIRVDDANSRVIELNLVVAIAIVIGYTIGRLCA